MIGGVREDLTPPARAHCRRRRTRDGFGCSAAITAATAIASAATALRGWTPWIWGARPRDSNGLVLIQNRQLCAATNTKKPPLRSNQNGGYLRELPAPYPGSVLAQGPRVGVRVRCRETSAAQVFLYPRPGGDRARCVPVRTANQGHPRSLTGKANTR